MMDTRIVYLNNSQLLDLLDMEALSDNILVYQFIIRIKFDVEVSLL
jgi:hypothetical protein